MNKIIGFTCSTFDLFHAGHVAMLEEAKQQCDWLIVGLQVDPTIDRPEKNKPVQSLIGRQIEFSALLRSPFRERILALSQ
jgi:glycerol-3-phosphate cytidylyltransferase